MQQMAHSQSRGRSVDGTQGLYHFGEMGMLKVLHRLLIVLIIVLAACNSPQVTQPAVMVQIAAEGRSFQVQLPAGSTVQDAITKADLTLSALDRVEPPVYTELSDGADIRITRVRESFEVEQVIIPFEHQVIQNDSLPVGESRLSQPGANGSKEVTYRLVYEDDVEISRSEVKTVVLQEALPEIVMLGSQTPFSSVVIPGRLVYLSAGNAWLMEKTTGNRRAIVTTGDLDSRVFSLSPDGSWLLFTRNTGEENTFNALWAARLDQENIQLIDLHTSNIAHFSQWGPDSNQIAYSTVEPRVAPPGWQANNDLFTIHISLTGLLSGREEVLPTNYGGVYGWWGMRFSWAPEGSRLAYARPDSMGLIDIEKGELTPLLDLVPLQTGADWAWVPGVSWGPDAKVIYTLVHTAPPGAEKPEESTQFDLTAVPLEGGAPVVLRENVGMFAYPSTSPSQKEAIPLAGEFQFQIAYLRADYPSQSQDSRYRLMVMDRDGSNERLVFPENGLQGLEPQQVVWSPTVVAEDGAYAISLLYQGNIWLINLADGLAQQITGDGLTIRIDWK